MTKEEHLETMARAMHRSFAISFSTHEPFSLGEIGVCRRGYASTPSVVVDVYGRERAGAKPYVAFTRQLVYRELESMGIPSECLAFEPTVETLGRRRKFVDRNESSPTFGRYKMGRVYRFVFEIVERAMIPTLRDHLPRCYEGHPL